MPILKLDNSSGPGLHIYQGRQGSVVLSTLRARSSSLLLCSPPKNCNTLSKKKAPVLQFCMSIRSIRKTNVRRENINLKPYSSRLSSTIGLHNTDEVDFYLLALSTYQA